MIYLYNEEFCLTEPHALKLYFISAVAKIFFQLAEQARFGIAANEFEVQPNQFLLDDLELLQLIAPN
jgi:hypothetical protein